jgi:hypothetical protein
MSQKSNLRGCGRPSQRKNGKKLTQHADRVLSRNHRVGKRTSVFAHNTALFERKPHQPGIFSVRAEATRVDCEEAPM